VHWATGGGGGSTDLANDMVLFGAPAEFAEVAQRDAVFEVEPENWPIVAAFMDCVTQWRIHEGSRIGLDYAAVVALLKVRFPDRVADMLTGVQVMEAAAIEEFAKG